jgi:hypothetical protein
MRGADRMTRVIRLWNNDVLSNRDGVLTVILEALRQEQCLWPAPHPTLSPLRFAARGEGVRGRRAPALHLQPARVKSPYSHGFGSSGEIGRRSFV